MPEGTILALNNDLTLHAILDKNTVSGANVQTFEGIISPGFVNAHCHLELSHLKNKIPSQTGLVGFAKKIITERGKTSAAEILEKMQDADRYMQTHGIVAVGDISNTGESFGVKQSSSLYYHTFIELIALNPSHATSVFENGLQLLNRLNECGLTGSLAAHAPYSVSKILIQRIAEFDATKGLSFSIHNQESEEETKFFKGEKSQFDDLYQFLGIDISYFNAPNTSSVQDYASVLTNTPSILVHNTVTKNEDIKALNSKNVFWCFCPNANLYIENKLPDYAGFSGNKQQLCLGTDSLASNTSLNLISEANTIFKHTRIFELFDILRMLTSNGARALGISETYGSLKPGANVGLNLLQLKNNQLHFIKKIT